MRKPSGGPRSKPCPSISAPVGARCTNGGAKRLVGQWVSTSASLDEKVQAATDLTRDDEVAVEVSVEQPRRPAAAAKVGNRIPGRPP
ncbi:DUF6192 family protein [Streptomyces sp. NPDC059153]|uniref:DUF6192 family protein n=1 Tax=Streptomyces sp. NPDC059153 TaxID=3346743 RepID=UPI0036AED008